jgi:hypothetical protein
MGAATAKPDISNADVSVPATSGQNLVLVFIFATPGDIPYCGRIKALKVPQSKIIVVTDT